VLTAGSRFDKWLWEKYYFTFMSFAGSRGGRGAGGGVRRGEAGAPRIDALALARSGGRVVGRVGLALMPRLEGIVASREGAVDYEIEGGQDGRGRPMLTIRVAGAVPLTCQVTLELFEYPYASETSVLLAQSEDQFVAWDEAEPEREVVLAAGPLAAAALVEDELLLGLPMSPRKPGLGEEPLVAHAGPGDGDALAGDSPFGELAKLRRR
jgi:uncharacterized protein